MSPTESVVAELRRANEGPPGTFPSGPGSLLRFPRRSSIFSVGTRAGTIYEIVSGTVLLVNFLPDGRRQIVEIAGPGDVIGLRTSTLSTTAAEVARECEVRAFSRHDLARCPRLAADFAVRLERQICRLHEHIVSLGRRNATERVAVFLVQMLRGSTGDPCHCMPQAHTPIRLSLPLTRAEIADHLGLSLETVCRTLNDFERRRWLAIGARHGEILVKELPQLCRAGGVCVTD